MKKNIDDQPVKENKTDLLIPLNSDLKSSKKLIQLPYYKLEERKNKENKKTKPLPKIKKREDHNMPKLLINNNELKPKKKKVILKKNQNNNSNPILKKQSDFILEKNIVTEIFSEENLLKTDGKASKIK